MRNPVRKLAGVLVSGLAVLVFCSPVLTFAAVDTADNRLCEVSAGAADNEQSVGDAEDVAGTGAANSEAVQDDRMTEIVEPNIPLSIRPYETGWSVVSLFASLITVIIGVVLTVLSVLRRSRKRHASNRLGLAIFGMAAAIVSTILFTSTEELQSQMILADSFTPVHVAMMAVAILCAFLFAKKETEELFSDNIPADNFR